MRVFFSSILVVIFCFFICSIVTCSGDDDDSASPTPTATPLLEKVSGTVYDFMYSPLSSAIVTVDGLSTTTNYQGYYEIPDVVQGTHTVTAVYNYSPQITLIETKIVEGGTIDLRFDFFFRITYPMGTITGTLDETSDMFPDNSSIKIMSISENGNVDYSYVYNDALTYELSRAGIGENRLLGIERDWYSAMLRYGVDSGISVNSLDTATCNLDMRADGTVFLPLSIPASFLNQYYGVSAGGFINFTPYKFFSDNGGDIFINAMDSNNSPTFELEMVPLLPGSYYTVALMVTQFSTTSFGNCLFAKNHDGSNLLTFNDEPVFITITSPVMGAENVGNTPVFTWSDVGAGHYKIDLFAYSSEKLVMWQLFCDESTVTLPEIEQFTATEFEDISVEISSRSDWNENFAVEDASYPEPDEYRKSLAFTYFFPDESPYLKSKETAVLRESLLQHHTQRTYIKTLDSIIALPLNAKTRKAKH